MGHHALFQRRVQGSRIDSQDAQTENEALKPKFQQTTNKARTIDGVTKTIINTCRQCSILSSLMSLRPIRVSPYLFAAHLTSSEVRSDFQILFSPGFRCNRGKHVRIPPDAAAHSTNSEVFDFHIWFSRAFWCSRGKHVRIPCTASRDQIHHRLWFCCDSFLTCIFLCSFRHRIRTIDGTEMADVEQTQKMVPLITCEINFPLSVCLRVDFWCQCIWFGSWGPNWFYQITYQEQLCVFRKHVSL